ncbi:hypothetical protein BT93_E1200 [Corymbia citriodora subsp. variegata]|nr:hypothetical protein BT93_E1200 [Corymbia citriodora subsp. variegata]
MLFTIPPSFNVLSLFLLVQRSVFISPSTMFCLYFFDDISHPISCKRQTTLMNEKTLL